MFRKLIPSLKCRFGLVNSLGKSVKVLIVNSFEAVYIEVGFIEIYILIIYLFMYGKINGEIRLFPEGIL